MKTITNQAEVDLILNKLLLTEIDILGKLNILECIVNGTALEEFDHESKAQVSVQLIQLIKEEVTNTADDIMEIVKEQSI